VQPGHHRAQRPRHPHRPLQGRLRAEAAGRPPQSLPGPGAPATAGARQPGGRHWRGPRPAAGSKDAPAGLAGLGITAWAESAAPTDLPEEAVMKAIVQDTYGSTDVLELRDISQPAIADDEVLIRVQAAGVD